MLALPASNVAFRKASCTDGKPTEFSQVAHELIRKLKAALSLLELADSTWRIAAQGEDILDAQTARLLNGFADLRLGRPDTSQMSHRGESVFALNPIGQHQGLLPGASSGAVGHGTKIRLDL